MERDQTAIMFCKLSNSIRYLDGVYLFKNEWKEREQLRTLIELVNPGVIDWLFFK